MCGVPQGSILGHLLGSELLLKALPSMVLNSEVDGGEGFLKVGGSNDVEKVKQIWRGEGVDGFKSV